MTLPAKMIEGHCIQLAPLETLEMELLEQNDPAEMQRLLDCSKSPGFCYVRLQDYDGGRYFQDLQTLYLIGKKYFDQPQETKMVDFRENEEKGYKPGHAQTLEISHDELLKGSRSLPESLVNEFSLVSNFVESSHTITKILLLSLSTVLNQPQLQRSHLDTEISASGLKLESVPTEAELKDVPFSEHTDMGTLTVLLCGQYTTEICMPGTQQWRFVEPREGCAIVNVGDALQKMTGGGLRSSVHRVGQPVSGKSERICILYYLRPSEAK